MKTYTMVFVALLAIIIGIVYVEFKQHATDLGLDLLTYTAMAAIIVVLPKVELYI